MPLDTPFKLGSFLVDRDGRLFLGAPDTTANLYLHWHGLSVTVRLSSDNGGTGAGRMSLSAVVGRVPSTASDPASAATRRAQALAQLHELAAAMGDGWRLALLPDHRASIEAVRDFAMPASAGALLTQVTCLLLGLAPYLDLLAESGLGIEAAGEPNNAGIANTCPG